MEAEGVMIPGRYIPAGPGTQYGDDNDDEETYDILDYIDDASEDERVYGEEYWLHSGNLDDKVDSDIVEALPAPHLPLRKLEAERLRAGDLQVRRVRKNTRGDVGSNAILPGQFMKLEPQEGKDVSGISIPNSPVRKALHKSSSFTRDRHNLEERAAALRTSMSIPNLGGHQRLSYRNISAPSPTEDTQSARSSPKPNRRHAALWRDGAPPDSLRGSYRSALTTGSSALDTERSSTFTDRSSASDYASGSPGWPMIREEDMSVEDAIGMYADGFADDPSDEVVPKKSLSPSPLSPRHHARYGNGSVARPESNTLPHSNVISQRPGKISKPELQPIQPIGYTTRAPPPVPIPTRNPTDDVLPPTPMFPITPTPYPARDRYGFKKDSQHVTLKSHDSWNASYAPYLARRHTKWLTLMRAANLPTENPTVFPSRSDKVKRYVRKGIPPLWRGAAWFHYAGGPAALAADPDLYSRTLARAAAGALSDDDREHIERDLNRTFPDNIKFKPDARQPLDVGSALHLPLSPVDVAAPSEPAMIGSLRRVLQAFAVHVPSVGYCQSLNFLAGHLLLFLAGDEARAFCVLCILTQRYLPGTHGVALEGANVDIGVLMHAVKQTLPGVWVRIDDRAQASSSPSTAQGLSNASVLTTKSLPTVSLATTPWFMSCFVSTLPPETVARVWDVLFYEGSRTLFRVALGIFRLAEPAIRTSSPRAVSTSSAAFTKGSVATGKDRDMDFMEAFQIIQTLPRTLLDADSLLRVALRKDRGSWPGAAGGLLSQETVDKRREERRGMYAKERALGGRAATMMAAVGEHGGTSGEAAEARKKEISRLKRFRSKVGGRG